jgi:hypothetical protein
MIRGAQSRAPSTLEHWDDRLGRFGQRSGTLSDRCSPDTAYQAFIERAAVYHSGAIANARVHEEERRRNEALTELDQLLARQRRPPA